MVKGKVHIINPYGTLPNEGWRKYRTNIVAEYFFKSGYDVTYWISNIDHRSKKQRAVSDCEISIEDNFKFKIIRSTNYLSNGSLGRIKYERNFGKRVRQIFFQENLESDIIIITDPALFYGLPIYSVAKKTKSKFIIDILDLWPEVFTTLFPKRLKWTADLFLSPLYALRKKVYKHANGFLAVTHDYLNVAKKAYPNIPGKVVYIGIENIEKSNFDFGPIKENDEVWIVYAGTLGINYDINIILDFAKKLEKSGVNAKLMIAGDGPEKWRVQDTISREKLKKTTFFGRLIADELNSLYSKCDIALSTYLASSTVSMPVKAFDCIAFGLPVINSLGREYGNLVVDKKIGLQYQPENVDSLFAVFIKLYNDRELLYTLKNNALNLQKEFDVEQQYSQYVEFVEKIRFI